jgi:hypothetical protein
MAAAAQATPRPSSLLDSKIRKTPGRVSTLVFGAVLVIGAIHAGWHLLQDLSQVHTSSALPFVLLELPLCIALGSEFVNGFHDTANAVATVIVSLLPVELILQVGPRRVSVLKIIDVPGGASSAT